MQLEYLFPAFVQPQIARICCENERYKKEHHELDLVQGFGYMLQDIISPHHIKLVLTKFWKM